MKLSDIIIVAMLIDVPIDFLFVIFVMFGDAEILPLHSSNDWILQIRDNRPSSVGIRDETNQPRSVIRICSNSSSEAPSRYSESSAIRLTILSCSLT